MRVVGLDLAGVETRPTGFCLLQGFEVQTCLLFTDEEIFRKVHETKPQVIAIDAPLCLPPGRRTIEERSSIHLRECDRALLKLGIKLFPATLGPMRKLTARGIRLREILQQKGCTVVEAYPGGAQDVLGIPRKKQGLEKLRLGLERLGIMGLEGIESDHELDAITCAYVGKLYLEGKAVTYGAPNQGIVMPEKP